MALGQTNCQRLVKIGWVAKCLLQPWIIASLTLDVCDIGSVGILFGSLLVEHGLLSTIRFGFPFYACD